MASIKTTSTSLFGEEPDDESFWLKVMTECLENPVTKLPTGKRLLVLGDNEAEKTLLVQKLQGGPSEVNYTMGKGLEYKYLSVKDEYCDNQTKLGVWILDGDPFYTPLLKYALDENSLDETTILLMASMTKPWDIFQTIYSWTDILKNHIEGLNLSESELQKRKDRVLERYREYIEPGLSIYGSLAADNTRELLINLGIEIIVVITRTEYMKELQTEFKYEEEHFDFIQLSLREFCLEHGAGLFYVSVKEDKNCDLLLKYILHKIYAFPFRIPAVLVERDSILVPSGWDTKNKIKFLSETLTTIPSSTPYENVVFKPARLSDTKRVAPEIVAQRDQEFLNELQSALERQAAEDRMPDSAKDSLSMTATVVQRNVARRMTRAQPGRSPQKKIETKLVPGEGDSTLSNFFHSLLNRRTSAPVDRPVGLSGTTRTFVPKNTLENLNAPNGNISNMDSAHKGSSQNYSTNSSSNHKILAENELEVEENFHSKLKSTAHLSLDQDKAHQLPEYFLSNPGAGLCTADCSFQSDSSFDLDEQFSPPLDRVKSAFNPPLKLLLEKSIPQQEDIPNGQFKIDDVTVQNRCALESDKESIPGFSLGRPETLTSSLPLKVNNHDQNSVDGT